MAFWSIKRSSGEKKRKKEERSEEGVRNPYFSSTFEDAFPSWVLLKVIAKNIQIGIQESSQYNLLITMPFNSSTHTGFGNFLTPISHGPCQSGFEIATTPAAAMITTFWKHWSRSPQISCIHIPEQYIQTEISHWVWRWVWYGVMDD